MKLPSSHNSVFSGGTHLNVGLVLTYLLMAVLLQAEPEAGEASGVEETVEEAHELTDSEREAAEALAAEERRIFEERQAAIGETMDRLKVGTRTYNGVVITRVDDVGVRIRHEAGMARVDFKSLPREMRKRFGFDEERAANQKREEKAEATKYERSVEAAENGGDDRASDSAPRSPRVAPRRSGPSSSRIPEAGEESEENLKLRKQIAALQIKIIHLEAGIGHARDQVESHRTKAAEYERSSHREVAYRDRDGNVVVQTTRSKTKMNRANTYRRRADAEEDKIREAGNLISKYKTQIEMLELELE